MSSEREMTAAAMAYYAECDDLEGLHRATEAIAPRVKSMVRRLMRKGGEEGIPGPADLEPGVEAAAAGEAERAVARIEDFGLLQALARVIGRRIEALELVAAAELPVGARVTVPESARYPRGNGEQAGRVSSSGALLRVALDGGGDWSGPPSLARRTEATQ